MSENRVVDATPESIKAYMNDHADSEYLLLDVREPKEYEQAHIPGARLLPLGQLETRLGDLPEHRDIIFACRSGARSRVAAHMAAEKMPRHQRLYNLEGGILGWQGHTVTDFPRVRLLILEEGMQQTLLAAMDLEKGAWNIYRHILEQYPGTALARTIEYLSQAEMVHAEALYDAWKEQEEIPPRFEDLFEGLKGEILEGGMALEDAMRRLESTMVPIDLAVYELALDIEFTAYDLYRYAGETTADPALKKLFLDISEGEKKHMNTIVGALDTAF
ncbi:rhodanese-like domain-containing protein [Desulfoluna spongiiphila]|uniref:Rhodanese-related sulfurtransferase n=1 Tax=Desulfoluna spongiiphila TaxID=419481 RepID=A0A1G5BJ89_9BACT|nr:rhodanese-like domain-containing protein [Desulfoluna spongiiphila]SCX90231.1 Rhodanese-related sulfurtransferase [Desulfoluna spongiiphila]VVS93771.1 ferritin-like [Desulfoluna spongiiphila]